jgi:REP element-mobilizing transposase RayT
MPALQKESSPSLPERVKRAQLAEHQVGDANSPSRTQGWRSRGYLPHFDHPGLIQAVTFRLADAMPAERRDEWELFSKIEDDAVRRQKIEDYLDAGHGSCVLRDDRAAQIVETALLFFDGQRYRLLAWVVMPNHVHVIVEPMPNHPLGSILHSWKSYTANEVNKLLRRTGALWEPEYHDRFIRDERHLKNAINYVHENPVKARLVKQAELWRWSSVRFASQSQAGKMPALRGTPPSGSAGILPAAALEKGTEGKSRQSSP